MSGIRKIDMLARVEGHGTVELIQAGGRVVDARLNLHESPRLIEALLVGRRFDEIADIACRICSICSAVHKVAALQAVERALGVSISRRTGLLRELAVQGGQIESHALHIFCLALPDYLGVNGFPGLAARAPDKLKMGLRIKKLGNLIQETVGGRAIHPFNLLVGGVGKVPDSDQLWHLKEKLAEIQEDVTVSIAFIVGLPDILPVLPLGPVCAVGGEQPLSGERLVTSTGTTVAGNSAVDWLNEQTVEHSHAKVSRFDGTTPYMVGPLARILLAMPAAYAGQFITPSIGSSLKARIVELQLAVQRAQELIEQIVACGLHKEPPVEAVATEGEGVSLIEAPRGVLLHRYHFDSHGVCRAANVITPTAINQEVMRLSLKNLVCVMDGAEYEEVRSAAEKLIRCYDPCISCAVH